MASKLYVGGLSYSTTSESLRQYFAQCGTVESATVITDRMSGDSSGASCAGRRSRRTVSHRRQTPAPSPR